MTWLSRDRLLTLMLVFALACASLAMLCSPASAAIGRQHPVGWDRVPRPALPAPKAAANGSVYVPGELRQIAVMPDAPLPEEDGTVDLGNDLGSPPVGGPNKAAFVGPNVRINNTAGDASNTTNSETYVAALGNDLVAGWNDGLNFGVSPGNSGYGYSSDGGVSWTDGGVPPVPPGSVARYEGDPCLTVDNAGNFYYSNLYTPDGQLSAVSVNRGTFAGTVFTWNLPTLPGPPTASDFLDKEWIAVDKVTGVVYVTYTRFLAAGGNQIEFTRSIDQGTTWSPPMILTLTANEGVQGSRVVVGPNNEVQVMYYSFDNATGFNYMRTRRSTDAGLTFGAEVTLPTGPSGIISNWPSGPPGFNRARGIGFPSLAVDRTNGPYQGHLYATWEEAVNFYFDPLGGAGTVNEVEPNDGGTLNATPVVIGQTVTGSLSSTSDQDWFSFHGNQGQTVILYLVPATGSPEGGFLRLFAGGSAVANRAALSSIGTGTALIIFTLPSTGTYYFRNLALTSTSGIGPYIIYTGWDSPDPGDEVARDCRDVILQSSPDGINWDTRRVINDDAPLFDNAFPEVAVNSGGLVFVDWYDHRNDQANGIGTDIYYNRSPNGGVLFQPSLKVNDGPSINWNLVASNLAPNMGDYSALVSDGCNVYANFADGRQGTPDSWFALINDCNVTPVAMSNVLAQIEDGAVDVSWSAFVDGMGEFQVLRSTNGTTGFQAVGTQSRIAGSSQYSFRDASVQPGAEYYYKIGYTENGRVSYSGVVHAVTPSAVFALRAARPNPARGLSRLEYEIGRAGNARLEIFNLSGQHVRTLLDGKVEVGAATAVWDGRDDSGARLPAGSYYARLTTAAGTFSQRIMMLR